MSEQLEFNQDIHILQKDGQLFAGTLAGIAPPVQLQMLDILLLANFAKPSDVDSVSQQFASDNLVRVMAPNIPPQAVKQRIQQFVQSGLITTKKSEAIDALSLDDYIVDDVQPVNGSLQLHRNFALSIGGDGLIIEPTRHEQPLTLTVDRAFTLLSVLQANDWQETLTYRSPNVSEAEHWQLLNAFVELGIIVAKRRINPEPVKKDIQPTSDVVAWKSLEPEQKVPVYFVPHTENHYPLALGLIYTAIADYLDGKLLEKFQLIPITYMTADELLAGPYRKFGAGIWLFSNYLWSEETNMAMSKFIKQDSPRNLCIHGGPSTPDYPDASERFFAEHTSVDIAVHAEGEVSICQILDALDIDNKSTTYASEKLNDILGISFRNYLHDKATVVHTDKRTRMKDPNLIPSPYMQGVFEHYGNEVEAAIIETNRGCPFGCTFCDWGSAINQKVRRFDMPRIKEEIEWIAKNKTKVLWIADANFGILDRDIEVADYIIAMKKQYGYPQEVVVNYTKNTTVKLVEIIKIFTEGGIISQGVISIQTMDTQTLEVIDRKNIKTSKYEELREIFSDLKLPLSTDLMLGLPGTTMQALKNDLQHYVEADVPVKAYPTQLLPNSPMADPEYMKKYQIETYDDGYLKSTFSYTEQDLNDMKLLYKVFTMADGYGLLRYVIRFMQWEYDVKAIDFLYDFMRRISEQPTKYPRLSFAMRFFESSKCVPTGWASFYAELKNYLIEHYSVADDSALETVLTVNQSVMPDESKRYPLTVSLDHDFKTYFEHNQTDKSDSTLKLSEQPSGAIEVSDPDGMVQIDDTYLQYDSHQFFWELSSDVSRVRSAFTI